MLFAIAILIGVWSYGCAIVASERKNERRS
jgi:hypothetical protein